jgi:hypothetical protein
LTSILSGNCIKKNFFALLRALICPNSELNVVSLLYISIRSHFKKVLRLVFIRNIWFTHKNKKQYNIWMICIVYKLLLVLTLIHMNLYWSEAKSLIRIWKVELVVNFLLTITKIGISFQFKIVFNAFHIHNLKRKALLKKKYSYFYRLSIYY